MSATMLIARVGWKEEGKDTSAMRVGLAAAEAEPAAVLFDDFAVIGTLLSLRWEVH